MWQFHFLILFTAFASTIANKHGFAPHPDKKHIIQDVRFGLLTGAITKTKLKETPYRAWTSVPYAEPPIRERRFKPAVGMSGWGKPGLYVIDATQDSPVCPQWTIDIERGVQVSSSIFDALCECLYSIYGVSAFIHPCIIDTVRM